jgi:hypothetical protein
VADSVETYTPNEKCHVGISFSPDTVFGTRAVANWKTANGETESLAASGLDLLGATLALANELTAIIEEWELGKRRRKPARKS